MVAYDYHGKVIKVQKEIKDKGNIIKNVIKENHQMKIDKEFVSFRRHFER